MRPYNPISRAAQLAWSELSSDRAVHWYGQTALTAAMDTIDTSILIAEHLYRLSVAIFQMGVFARSWLDQFHRVSTYAATPKLLPQAKIAGYLPSISTGTPLTVKELQQLCRDRGLPTRTRNRRHNKVELVRMLTIA